MDESYPRLNFPTTYEFSLRRVEGRREILDALRKKYVRLTPEEWVRQHLLRYLIELGYPAGLIAVEKGYTFHGKIWRADVVVHRRQGQAFLLAECKAPKVALGPAAFEQIARYNRTVGAQYLVISNGLVHYCYAIDRRRETYQFLDHIPPYIP